MEIKQIETRLKELKVQQGDHFKKKKADRDPATLDVVREEMNRLKAEAKANYTQRKISKS